MFLHSSSLLLSDRKITGFLIFIFTSKAVKMTRANTMLPYQHEKASLGKNVYAYHLALRNGWKSLPNWLFHLCLKRNAHVEHGSCCYFLCVSFQIFIISHVTHHNAKSCYKCNIFSCPKALLLHIHTRVKVLVRFKFFLRVSRTKNAAVAINSVMYVLLCFLPSCHLPAFGLA